MEQWLTRLKDTSIDALTSAFGEALGRNLGATFQGSTHKGYGPCPECGATQRSSSDRRRPLGLNSNHKGAKCHAEQHPEDSRSIDVVDLVALCATRKRFKDLSADERAPMRELVASMGLCSAPEQGPIRRRPSRPVASTAASDGGEDDDTSEGLEVSTSDGGDPSPKAQGRGSRGFTGPLELYEGCHDDLIANRDSGAQGHVYGYLEQRGFDDKTIREWRLGCYFVHDADGVLREEWLVIPLKDQHGRVVNYRFRSVPGPCLYCTPTGEAKGPGCKECSTKQVPTGGGVVFKKFRPVTGAPLPLFGSHKLSPDRAQPVVILEGELDVIAAWQFGLRESVVTGTAGAGAFKDEWLDLIEPYQSFVLGLDPDKAGNTGAAALATKLGMYRCSRLTLPHKDMADCLQAGVEASDIDRALELIQPMVATRFEMASHYIDELEELIANPDRLKGIPVPLRPFNDALGGVRPGLTVVTGDTAAGKSTFATFVAFLLAQAGVPCLLTSFEQTTVGTLQKLLRMQMRGDFTRRSKEERAAACEDLDALPIRIMDRNGTIKATEVIDNIRYAKRRFGTRFFMIDHLGYLTQTEENELKAINKVIHDFSDLSKEEQVTIWLICHPSNSNKIERRRVNMSDLKGSSDIRQWAHEVIVVERGTISKARQYAHTNVYFDKVRSEFGGNGAECTLAFDPIALVYTESPEESPTYQGGGRVVDTRATPTTNRRRAKDKKETA